jgi:uncharacterized membrane protein
MILNKPILILSWAEILICIAIMATYYRYTHLPERVFGLYNKYRLLTLIINDKHNRYPSVHTNKTERYIKYLISGA